VVTSAILAPSFGMKSQNQLRVVTVARWPPTGLRARGARLPQRAVLAGRGR
jgi:hypothetical protein